MLGSSPTLKWRNVRVLDCGGFDSSGCGSQRFLASTQAPQEPRGNVGVELVCSIRRITLLWRSLEAPALVLQTEAVCRWVLACLVLPLPLRLGAHFLFAEVLCIVGIWRLSCQAFWFKNPGVFIDQGRMARVKIEDQPPCTGHDTLLRWANSLAELFAGVPASSPTTGHVDRKQASRLPHPTLPRYHSRQA